MKHLFLLALSATMVAGASAAPKAAGSKAAAPAKTSLKALNYCPIAGEKLHAKTVGNTTYKGYKVAFCCPGCPEEFARLSTKEKDAKIAKVVAKQAKAGAKPKA